MKIIKYENDVLVKQYGGVNAKECFIEESFKPAMDRLCKYALECAIHLFVNSSKRDTTIVPGHIVEPAKMSNHLVGHAIDANIIESGTFWNSEKLEGVLSPTIHKFINLIHADKELRWGGTFENKDVVHFDDGLNIHNPSLWHEIYNAHPTYTC